MASPKSSVAMSQTLDARASEGGTWRARRRRRLKSLVVAAAIGLAVFLLYRALRPYSIAELRIAVSAVPGTRLAGAAGFAAASYLCLTLFDYLGLHYAGRPLPYRKAALASFCSLSLGHTIGLSALSSGAIRYRFYSRWGLGAEEVAKVMLFSGATVGLGLTSLLAVALLGDPALAQDVTGLSAGGVRSLGAVCLALPTLYLGLAAGLRTPLRIKAWSFQLPSVRLAGAPILVGVANFACVAGCLHQTVAAIADVAYPGVVAAYVIANASSLVAHVPGGLGVIETVVQHLLSERDLIGPLLVFRFTYFLVPLALGSLALLVSEMVMRKNASAQRA